MTTLTINLPDDRMLTLQERAEELVRVSVEELLSRPEADFQHALDYVLRKNADLYRRPGGKPCASE